MLSSRIIDFKIPPSAGLSHLGFDDIVERCRDNIKHRLNKVICVIQRDKYLNIKMIVTTF
jgi:hypothetical protein